MVDRLFIDGGNTNEKKQKSAKNKKQLNNGSS